MINDRQLSISVGRSRTAQSWPRQTMLWSELIKRLETPQRGAETLVAYTRLPKPQQDELKDVGGFVGGTLVGTRRKGAAVESRTLITLDLDSLPPGSTDTVLSRLSGLGCGWAVYSTRKHEPASPRLRVLIPLSRPATADEYEPVARKLAELIGIEWCDPSTFEASRLMYWPSCCADSQYVHKFEDKPWADTDGILAMYADWKDYRQWAQVPGAVQRQQQHAKTQEDPTAKRGVVGAFCRTYNVLQAMDELLPGVYEPCDLAEDRYSYTGGSTAGGAVIYNGGAYLYSHHATDPAGGKLCNAFDLVRLHKFAHLDDSAAPGTPVIRMPSYKAMQELAREDGEVLKLMIEEQQQAVVDDFGTAAIQESDIDWMLKLEREPSGNLTKTIDNAMMILRNDSRIKDRIAYDEFANRVVTQGGLPWNADPKRRTWSDTDDSGMMYFMEHGHRLFIPDKKLMDALALRSEENKFNPVQEYLDSQVWDGVPRLDTLFIDYLGADDNEYVRTVTRKSLAAAVARAMEPGVKYDNMLILTGGQGIGKSTTLRLLGKDWYSDSLQTFEGKEACEMIQGVWINEIGELNGFSRSEVGDIKQFLSRTEDLFRAPYGRRTNAYPRSCVFFGTTNDDEFLRDPTGNRRFWPVKVGRHKPKYHIFTQFPLVVELIWAEAVEVWKRGEPLFLAGSAEDLAKNEQEAHREHSAKEGLVLEFLNEPIPLDWNGRDINFRRAYFNGALEAQPSTDRILRDRICAAEVWCECFGQDKARMRQSDTREINAILGRMPGWTRQEWPVRFGPYGQQRGFNKEQISIEEGIKKMTTDVTTDYDYRPK